MGARFYKDDREWLPNGNLKTPAHDKRIMQIFSKCFGCKTVQKRFRRRYNFLKDKSKMIFGAFLSFFKIRKKAQPF